MAWQSNSSFSQEVPRLQISWDSTSLGALKTCPRQYYYSIVCGWTSRSASIHLEFGAAYHSALEHYDHARSAGADHEEAILAAVKQCLVLTWDAKLSRPLAVFCEDKNKNRETLVRTVVWYLDQFSDDYCQTWQLSNGKPAVELSFSYQLSHQTSTGVHFSYCGHIDRVVSIADEPHVLDRKTTKYTLSPEFFQKFNPHNQFLGYIFSSKVILPKAPRKIIVDAAQIAVTFSHFERGIIEFSEHQLDEWHTSLGFWLKLAEGFAQANFWPMNELSCDNYGGCPFRPVCSCKSEEVKNLWLKAKFVKRVWDPLCIRGDI